MLSAKVNKRDVWLRLVDYTFDNLVLPSMWERVAASFGGHGAATRAFANKLATKRGWSVAFALLAVEEYKKFVFLGVVTDFPVTPSKTIDAVWHQHLQFTRAYREFCRDVLQRDFDHNPELVPVAEQTEQFHEQYLLTLAAYRREFDTEPPDAIWAKPKFQLTEEYRRHSARPRRVAESNALAAGDADLPLYMLLPSDPGGSPTSTSPGFAAAAFDGGESGGGGGGSAFSSIDSSPAGVSGASAGGDSGGSSCSSSCGGGGCGGD